MWQPEYEGMGKAVDVASQVAKTTLESQGKKQTVKNTGMETIKTLGEPRLKQGSGTRKLTTPKAVN